MQKKTVYTINTRDRKNPFIIQWQGYDYVWFLDDEYDTRLDQISIVKEWGYWYAIDDLTGYAINQQNFPTRKSLLQWLENAPASVKSTFRKYRYGSYEDNREYNRMRETFMSLLEEFQHGSE